MGGRLRRCKKRPAATIRREACAKDLAAQRRAQKQRLRQHGPLEVGLGHERVAHTLKQGQQVSIRRPRTLRTRPAHDRIMNRLFVLGYEAPVAQQFVHVHQRRREPRWALRHHPKVFERRHFGCSAKASVTVHLGESPNLKAILRCQPRIDAQGDGVNEVRNLEVGRGNQQQSQLRLCNSCLTCVEVGENRLKHGSRHVG